MTRIVPLHPEALMPPEAPLALPEQDLARPFRDPAAPAPDRTGGLLPWRLGVFGPSLMVTLFIVGLFTDFFAMGGLSPFEALLIAMVAFTFFWIAVSVGMVGAGLVRLGGEARSRPDAPGPTEFSRNSAGFQPALSLVAPEPSLDVALLIPIHEEAPEAVLGNALAMLEDLAAHPGSQRHRFALFILSDSRSAGAAEAEARAFAALRIAAPYGIPVHYRRFPENTDRKIGNIAQWVRRWGGAWEGMVVLDADSLMSASAITELADAMAADPSAGLVQTTPWIVEAETLFGRIQQFATRVYGPLLGAGLAAWTGPDGNYWGHNAILRTRAFAASAGLPRIGRAQALVMSHDFVEAALLRRAGWTVRMIPGREGSYEEAPGTLIDYVRRDARWCRGNLQHLRLLATRGLRPVSRFHLFQGAMSYLVSPVWLALLLIWAAIGVGEERSLVVYFSGNDPRPHWPELTGAKQLGVLLFMYGMLLAPKVVGGLRGALHGRQCASYGGPAAFSASLVTEIVLSVIYAPILMVQQTRAIAAGLFGRSGGWQGYRGAGTGAPQMRVLLRFHALETLVGAALTLGIGSGFVTLWFLPIALSLLFSAPLSRLSGVKLSDRPWLSRLMATPETLSPPPVLARARITRDAIARAMRMPQLIAAE